MVSTSHGASQVRIPGTVDYPPLTLVVGVGRGACGSTQKVVGTSHFTSVIFGSIFQLPHLLSRDARRTKTVGTENAPDTLVSVVYPSILFPMIGKILASYKCCR